MVVVDVSLAASDDRRQYFHRAMFSVKNHNILNVDALYFKLARSVMKIGSFEFANLKYFQVHSRLTCMNLKSAGLVWNAKCQIQLQSCSR